MTDYQIQTNTRRCTATGRELRAGEKVYTVLLDEKGQFIRQDYCSEAWPGPPAGAFSFWAGKVPAQDEVRRLRIDDDLLMDCFQRLEGQVGADRVNFRYVVALLLMRRKKLKFDATKKEGEREYLCLRCPKTGTTFEVVNPCLSEQEMDAVQEEVFKVLGWDG